MTWHPFFPQGEEEYMVACLREADPHEMVNVEFKVGVQGIMGLPFVPVLDGAFFPESPGEKLYFSVAFAIGYCTAKVSQL